MNLNLYAMGYLCMIPTRNVSATNLELAIMSFM